MNRVHFQLVTEKPTIQPTNEKEVKEKRKTKHLQEETAKGYYRAWCHSCHEDSYSDELIFNCQHCGREYLTLQRAKGVSTSFYLPIEKEKLWQYLAKTKDNRL